MARILFVDDKRGMCDNVKEKLTDLGHHVETIARTIWSDACKEAQNKMNESYWDVLVLDMHYDSQRDIARPGDFGGIWLHNDLVKLGLRAKWRHTIVYSRYLPPDWGKKSEGATLAVRVFLDTAGIPYDCALTNDAFSPDKLSERIASL
jgi:CheY-like chemotaxis protein